MTKSSDDLVITSTVRRFRYDTPPNRPVVKDHLYCSKVESQLCTKLFSFFAITDRWGNFIMGFLKRTLCEGELKEGQKRDVANRKRTWSWRSLFILQLFCSCSVSFLQLCNTFEAAPKYRVEATLKSWQDERASTLSVCPRQTMWGRSRWGGCNGLSCGP